MHLEFAVFLDDGDDEGTTVKLKQNSQCERWHRWEGSYSRCRPNVQAPRLEGCVLCAGAGGRGSGSGPGVQTLLALCTPTRLAFCPAYAFMISVISRGELDPR